MHVNIVTQPAMRAATIRHLGSYATISEAFERLGAIAAENDLFGPDATMLALYHDDPSVTPEDALRSDAALTLSDGVTAPKGTKEATVPGGRYAKLVYTGPYEGLPAAWEEMMGWVGGSDEQMADSMAYELYRNDPSTTPPEELITELYMPLS